MAHYITTCTLALLALCCVLLSGAHAAPQTWEGKDIKPWRIRFLEAAIIRHDRVLLGGVTVPLGDMSPARWDELTKRELWPAPKEGDRPVNMTRPRLQEAVMATVRDLAPYCLFPGSMIL